MIRYLAFVLVCSAFFVFFALKHDSDKDGVPICEVKSELGFGAYEKENWDAFFSVYHKEYLNGGMVRQLLDRLGIASYAQVPDFSENQVLTREEWNEVYLQILDYLDMEKEVEQKQILVLDIMEAEEENILITNQGDYYTTLPVTGFEKWQAYDIFGKETKLLGIKGESKEEAVLANAYLKTFSEEKIEFLYLGAEYEKEIGNTEVGLQEGVCDLVFRDGNIQTLRMKQDLIEGELLSYDEDVIEIDGYGKISHTGKVPVYQVYGEVIEKAISDVVLGNMKVEYVTGENEICAILISQPANIENIRVLLLGENGGNFRPGVYLKCSTDAQVNCGTRTENVIAGTLLNLADYVPADSTDTFVLTPTSGEGLIYICDAAGNVAGNGYAGIMEGRWYQEGYTLVNELPFETYLCAVVPSEMPSNYAMEALKAQAICARSYAYIQLLRADLAKYGAHINDSTSYQVYNKTAATEQSKAAVSDTAGKILTWQGKTVEAYYFSTSMGYTDTAEVWNVEDAKNYGYLKKVCLNEVPASGELSKEDDFLSYIREPAAGYDGDIKYSRWMSVADYTAKTSQMNEILESRRSVSPRNILLYETDGATEKDSLKEMGSLLKLTVEERSSSGSILTLRLQYEKGIALVKTEYNIRKVLGCGMNEITYQDGSKSTEITMLPSAFVSLCPQEDGTYLLFGGGYGHGLGMSQNAANGMAKAGMSCEDILQYFYNDIKIEQMTQ